MKKERRKFSPSFKAKVAIEAIKEASTLQELASKYSIHPTQITSWKREFLEKADTVFGSEKHQRLMSLKKRSYILRLVNYRSRLIF